MSKNTYKESYKEIVKDEIVNEDKSTKETEISVKENKPAQESKSQKFKVYSVVSEKAVMVRGLKDNKWYSKVNNGYRIGDIIE